MAIHQSRVHKLRKSLSESCLGTYSAKIATTPSPSLTSVCFHAAENSSAGAEGILQNQYVPQVHQDTIQRYAERFGNGVADRYGVQIAGSTLLMNFFSLVLDIGYSESVERDGVRSVAT